MKYINVTISDDTKERLDRYRIAHRWSISGIVEKALNEFFSQNADMKGYDGKSAAQDRRGMNLRGARKRDSV